MKKARKVVSKVMKEKTEQGFEVGSNQSNLKLIHSHIVSNHLSQRPPNKVLQDQTPSVSPAELLLSRETRRTLAQHRTNKSPLLVSYLFSIGDLRHPSPLCPLCLMHDHTSSHLFECKSLPTSLSSLDLWTNPDKVEPFLATWGRDCWLPHDSGAGLCWQHIGGVGSTTTTTEQGSTELKDWPNGMFILVKGVEVMESCFIEKDRRGVWKVYMERIMDEENDCS